MPALLDVVPAASRPPSARRIRRARGLAQMRFQSLEGHSFKTLAHLNDEKIVRPLVDCIWSSVRQRQRRGGWQRLHIHKPRSPQLRNHRRLLRGGGDCSGATHGTPELIRLMKSSGGSSAADSSWPGSCRGAPYTSSAAEIPEFSRGATLIPSIIHGKC
jgi:hypothetical protein